MLGKKRDRNCFLKIKVNKNKFVFKLLVMAIRNV